MCHVDAETESAGEFWNMVVHHMYILHISFYDIYICILQILDDLCCNICLYNIDMTHTHVYILYVLQLLYDLYLSTLICRNYGGIIHNVCDQHTICSVISVEFGFGPVRFMGDFGFCGSFQFFARFSFWNQMRWFLFSLNRMENNFQINAVYSCLASFIAH